MSENPEPYLRHDGAGGTARARQPGPAARHENPTTQQMRIIGQRRAEAEEKLAQHLEQARHLAKKGHPAAGPSAGPD